LWALRACRSAPIGLVIHGLLRSGNRLLPRAVDVFGESWPFTLTFGERARPVR
jgi:hypothetical protein